MDVCWTCVGRVLDVCWTLLARLSQPAQPSPNPIPRLTQTNPYPAQSSLNPMSLSPVNSNPARPNLGLSQPSPSPNPHMAFHFNIRIGRPKQDSKTEYDMVVLLKSLPSKQHVRCKLDQVCKHSDLLSIYCLGWLICRSNCRQRSAGC